MHRITRKLLPAAVAALCAAPAFAAQTKAPTSDDSLTIYSSLQPGAVSPDLYRPAPGRGNPHGQVPGYAIVRHDRAYDLARGLQSLRVTDVAALIDPTTVTFASLTEPGTRVLEQGFEFDLVSSQKLLQRYLGQRVVLEQPVGDDIRLVEGTLLGASDGLTLQMDDGSVQVMRSYGNIRFAELPGGLNTKPTLEWLLESPRAGAQDTRISYETQGLTWWADYNIVYDESKSCEMDLSGWVSIINQSGASYDNARLKLIAGDVNRATAPEQRREVVAKLAMAEFDAAAPQFTEKAFFEYHLYTLGRRTDLPDNATRQMELFPAAHGVPCKKELVFAPTLEMPWWGYQQFDQEYGRYGNGDVSVFLRFANAEEDGLGIPLPAGRIRVNQADPADGSLEFIGEDTLDHTPRDEQVLIEMGTAFDVVGERKQADFRVDYNGHHLWETFEITLRNHKDSKVDVVVLENLYRAANWKIENHTLPFTKENSNRIRFDVVIPARGEAVLKYTAHYTW